MFWEEEKLDFLNKFQIKHLMFIPCSYMNKLKKTPINFCEKSQDFILKIVQIYSKNRKNLF